MYGRTAVVGHPKFKPIRDVSQLTHSPLSPVLDGVDVDIDVVAPVRSVLDVGQTKYVEQFMSSSNMIYSTSSLSHGSKHQHMRTRSLEISCNDNAETEDNNNVEDDDAVSVVVILTIKMNDYIRIIR